MAVGNRHRQRGGRTRANRLRRKRQTQRVITEIHAQVAGSRNQIHRARARPARAAPQTRIPLPRRRHPETKQRPAGRKIRRVDGHRVSAGRLREEILAVEIRHGMVRNGHPEAVCPRQGQTDAGNSRLVGVLHAVGIEVQPHEIANRHRLVNGHAQARLAVIGIGHQHRVRAELQPARDVRRRRRHPGPAVHGNRIRPGAATEGRRHLAVVPADGGRVALRQRERENRRLIHRDRLGRDGAVVRVRHQHGVRARRQPRGRVAARDARDGVPAVHRHLIGSGATRDRRHHLAIAATVAGRIRLPKRQRHRGRLADGEVRQGGALVGVHNQHRIGTRAQSRVGIAGGSGRQQRTIIQGKRVGRLAAAERGRDLPVMGAIAGDVGLGQGQRWRGEHRQRRAGRRGGAGGIGDDHRVSARITGGGRFDGEAGAARAGDRAAVRHHGRAFKPLVNERRLAVAVADGSGQRSRGAGANGLRRESDGQGVIAEIQSQLDRRQAQAGERGARVQIRGIHRHRVCSRGLGKGVMALAIGRHMVDDGDASLVFSRQGQRHARNPEFIGVLDAVAVQVEPDVISHGDRLIEPEVNIQVGGTGRQRGRHGAGGAGLAVQSDIGPLPGGGIGQTRQRGAGQEVRRIHRDRVGARRLGKIIIPVGVGGGMRADRAGGNINARQGQPDIRNTDLAGLLDAVAVRVRPDVMADGHGLVESKVQIQIAAAGGQDHRHRGAAAAAVGQAALPGLRGRVTRGGRHRHGVNARRHGEEIITAIRRGRGEIDRGARAIRATQGHRHSIEARLIGVLNAVGIGVVPHIVTNGHRLVVPEVQGEIASARGQRGGSRAAAAAVGAIAFAHRGGHITGQGATRREIGRIDRHRVAAGKFGKQILAVRPRGGVIRDRRAGHAGARQRQTHVGNARRSPVILDAVAVGVSPHIITEGNRPVEPEINRKIISILAHGSRGGIAVAVGGRGAFRGGGEYEARQRAAGIEVGGVHGNRVSARHFGEEVLALSAAHCVIHDRSAALRHARQSEAHAGNPRFARILHAVAIGVLPDEIANRDARHGHLDHQVLDGGERPRRGKIDQHRHRLAHGRNKTRPFAGHVTGHGQCGGRSGQIRRRALQQNPNRVLKIGRRRIPRRRRINLLLIEKIIQFIPPVGEHGVVGKHARQGWVIGRIQLRQVGFTLGNLQRVVHAPGQVGAIGDAVGLTRRHVGQHGQVVRIGTRTGQGDRDGDLAGWHPRRQSQHRQRGVSLGQG